MKVVMVAKSDHDWIKENVFNERGKINPRSSSRIWWQKLGKESLYDKIISYNENLSVNETYAARIFCFLNEIREHPCCEVCGVHTRYHANMKKFALRCSDHALTEEARNKREETNAKLYNSAKNFSNPKHTRQSKNTMIAKYGTDNIMSLQETVQKIKKTNLSLYGDESFSRTDDYKEKRAETLQKKYGVTNLWDLLDYRNKLSGSMNANYNENYENIDKIISDIKAGTYTRTEICEKFNVSFSHLLKKLKDVGEDMSACKFEPIKKSSLAECEISQLFAEHEPETNNRSVLNGFELDTYFQKRDFAIEYCGDYWHSYSPSDRKHHSETRHQAKTLLSIEKNIELFTIFEHEWNNVEKKSIWISKINLKLGVVSERIFARKCSIRIVNAKETKKFLEANHLQGSCSSSINIGLFYNDLLCSILTMGKSRYDKKYEYELIRFASLKNTVIIGGFTRLLTAFEKQYQPRSILSYCNLRWSIGNIYEQSGFQRISVTAPNYMYMHLSKKISLSRVQCQKHKLKKVLGVDFDPALTERENMYNNGYRTIHDCGNIKFVKEY
jgi:hypothetical protein